MCVQNKWTLLVWPSRFSSFFHLQPSAEEEEFRYIPDKEMEDLRSQMKAIDEAREERRKK